jgi:hypothetical protein
MAVTKALDGGAVWGANYITTSTTVADDPDGSHASRLTNYPVSNLKNPLRTKTTRVTYNDNASATYDITFVFGTAVPLASLGLAFVDWNLPASTRDIVVHAGSGTGYGTTWTIDPYVGDNGVARYYLDTFSGASITSATHWKISFADDYSISESYLEIGEIVLATYIDVDISTPFGRTVQNPSTYATSYGGQEYVDEKNFFNAIALNTTPMNSTSLYTLQNSIAAVGSAHTILDVHAASASVNGGTTVSTLDKASTYYGRLHKGIKTSIKGFNNSTLSLSFGEARK